ncbi:MAG: carbohydrate binding domain-containing protein [Phycisphaeraceae bacterium JB051]
MVTSFGQAQTINNPGFESSSLSPDWKANAAVYQLDHSVAHSGKAAVRWQNNDPKRYLHCQQDIELDPASEYIFQAWVKTQDVKDGNATIAVEFYTGDKFHSGMYPKGITGTTDWTVVKTDSFVLPQGVTRAHVMCYARRGATGTAWFDDASLIQVKSQLMQSVLRYPSYRGLMVEGQNHDIALRVNLAEHTPANAQLKSQLIDADGKVLKTQKNAVKTGLNDVVMPAGQLVKADYTLQLDLVDTEDEQLATMQHRIHVVDDAAMPRIMIDEYQRLIVDGKPILPIGVYDNVRASDADLKLLEQSPVNCMLAYGKPSIELLDRLDAHNLKLIASVKDYYLGHKWTPRNLTTVDDEAKLMRPLVKTLRDHPALLAWYLNDELPLSYMDRFKAHYQWILEDDPAHPALTVLMRPHQIDRYLHTADVLGSDPYPLPHKPIELVRQWTKKTVDLTFNTRGVWQVVQTFNWQNYRTQTEHQTGKTPTQAQLRNMIWQCLTNGANGILLYSLYDMQRNPDVDFQSYWPQVCKVLEEVQQHAPAILSIESAPFITMQTDDLQAFSIRVTHWQDATYAFVVSTSDQSQVVRFNSEKPITQIQELSTAKVIQPTNSKHWQDTFKPLEVRVYQLR